LATAPVHLNDSLSAARPSEVHLGEANAHAGRAERGQAGVGEIPGQGLEQVERVVLHPVAHEGENLVVIDRVAQPVGLLGGRGVELELDLHVEARPGLPLGGVGSMMAEQRQAFEPDDRQARTPGRAPAAGAPGHDASRLGSAEPPVKTTVGGDQTETS